METAGDPDDDWSYGVLEEDNEGGTNEAKHKAGGRVDEEERDNCQQAQEYGEDQDYGQAHRPLESA